MPVGPERFRGEVRPLDDPSTRNYHDRGNYDTRVSDRHQPREPSVDAAQCFAIKRACLASDEPPQATVLARTKRIAS